MDEKTITAVLEPLIRRIVREELERIVGMNPKSFRIAPGMPLHDDLLEVHRRKAGGSNEFYSHEEVWGE